MSSSARPSSSHHYLQKNGDVDWNTFPHLLVNLMQMYFIDNGKYDRSYYNKDGFPLTMSQRQVEEYFKELTVQLGLPEAKWEHVRMQIAHTLCTSPVGDNPTLIKRITHNRSVAMKVGLLTPAMNQHLWEMNFPTENLTDTENRIRAELEPILRAEIKKDIINKMMGDI